MIVSEDVRIRPAKSPVEQLLGSNENIRRLTGRQPKYKLQQGIRQTIAWFGDEENVRRFKIGMSIMFEKIVDFIKLLYPAENPVPLHAPRFSGNEKKYLIDCIDTTYVSYVGQYVSRFEDEIRQYTCAKHAVAVSTGTAALHVALLLAEVAPGDEVITQPLTFVATVNAISYCGAHPVFVDVERSTLGLDPEKLDDISYK